MKTFLPFAVAAFDYFCEKPSWGRAALAAAAGTAVFFSHFLPWTMYLGCAGLVGLGGCPGVPCCCPLFIGCWPPAWAGGF